MDTSKDLQKFFMQIDAIIPDLKEGRHVNEQVLHSILSKIDHIRAVLDSCEKILEKTNHEVMPDVLSKQQLESISNMLDMNVDSNIEIYFDILQKLRSDISRSNQSKNTIIQDGQEAILDGRNM